MPRRQRNYMRTKAGRRLLAERIVAQDRMVEDLGGGLFGKALEGVQIQEVEFPESREALVRGAERRTPIIGRFQRHRLQSESDDANWRRYLSAFIESPTDAPWPVSSQTSRKSSSSWANPVTANGIMWVSQAR